tara:strand:+ start:1387 stop:1845 length:459 start_codon:yes stop_codon:yes gene_type:complete
MIERYLMVLEDFMINEQLCINLNIDGNFDKPTFINDIYEEVDIIRQEFNLNDSKFIVLLDFTKIIPDDHIINEICDIVNKVEDHLMKNIDKFIIYKTNSKTDYILRLIEHRVSRLLFDKIVGDANISNIVNNALNDKNLLTSISHPVKTDSN